jgi:photosystem II stability/assembly factor-like uncharacterized protein
MRKVFLIAVSAMFAMGVKAQPWIDNGKKEKLDDIIKRYQQSNAASKMAEEDEDVSEKGEREGKNYHFDRWAWYWNQHLDEEGYMVSPVQTVNEWNRYRAANAKGKPAFKTTNQSNWSFVGPNAPLGGNNGIGRINMVAFHPTDSNTYVIGSAGGGAWRTENGGINWTCLSNTLPVHGVSDIDYNPLNPNTIYLCTGDLNAGDNYSAGLFKSFDGGATWQPTGLQFNVSSMSLTNVLHINPLDTNSLVVGTSAGIFKSNDGGTAWTLTATGEFKDIEYHPIDTNILYAASYSNGNSNIFRSADGGYTWTQVTSFTSNTRRIELAVTAANPAIVKAVIARADNNGLYGFYSSSDTGKTFSRIFGSTTSCNTNILNGSNSPSSTSCDGQGWYDLAITMSQVDSNKVLVGGINTWQSSNGGLSWQLVTQAYGNTAGIQKVHADKHYLIFHPLSPNLLFECNDGGIVKTYSPASTLWTDIASGLGITQFYRLAVNNATTFAVGGAQDNGTKKVNFSGTSSQLTGGDGMDCQMDYSDPNIFYTSSQYGNINKTTNGANFSNISGTIPGQPTGDWITPFLIHPTTPATLLAGYQHVYKSTNRGSSWTDISPTFPTTVNIRRLALTPLDPNMIYMLSGNYTLKYSPDMGANWNTIAITSGFSGVISDIQVDPKNKNRLWVSYSGYTVNRVSHYTIGTGWTKVSDSLPKLPANCLTFDTSNSIAYVGTDVGVFYKDTSMTAWAPYNTGLPVVEVRDLAINYTTNEVWAATYGRGMWRSPKMLLVPNGISDIPYATDVITVAPNPNSGSFVINTGNQAIADQQVVVKVMSFTGATVMQKNLKFNNGKLPVSTDNLARGTYIVEVQNKGQVFARTKMVIL